MSNFNYLEAVKADVKNYLEYDFDLEAAIEAGQFTDFDEIETTLYDDLWTDDSVTGNGSGSYTFNRAEAKELVFADTETVLEALKEFCVNAETIAEKFLEEDFEYFDVTARCYVLGQAISEALEEIREEIEKALEEYNNKVYTA